jgi:hypothetical protein
MRPRILLISANIGNYDSTSFVVPDNVEGVQLLLVKSSSDRYGYRKLTLNTFCLALPHHESPSNRILSRIPKINPLFLFSDQFDAPSFFPVEKKIISQLRSAIIDFDYLVWIDANCRIESFDALKQLCSKVSSNGWGIYAHSDRCCLYKEARCVKSLPYVKRDILNCQIAYYRKQGVPRNYGLYSCNFIIRSRASLYNAQSLWNLWMSEFLRWVPRDQISLPYCLFQFPHHLPTILGKFAWNNSAFSFAPHTA